MEPEPKKKTILIAEDEQHNMELATMILSMLNVRIIHAQNGQEAVDLFANNPDTSIILMDLKMPKMNGLEATRIIREGGASIPIIALTAQAMEGDREKALEAGCNDYITKPVSFKQLLEKVKEYL